MDHARPPAVVLERRLVRAHVPRAGFASEVPPDGEPVAPLPGVHLVDHRPVVVAVEAIGDRPELVQVEVPVAGDEGIEGPPHLGDPLVECLRALRELERVADPSMTPNGQRGEHVRVRVQPLLGIHPGPSQDVPDHLVAVERAVRHVPAIGERAEHLARKGFGARPRGVHDPQDAIRVLERCERSELDAGGASRIECQLPGVALHGAGV